MSPVAIVIVVFGVLIALTRGPLFVAPLRVRDYYLRLFNTDARMRLVGLTGAILGAACVWAAQGVSGTAAELVNAFGIFIFVLMAAFLIPFAGTARKLATAVWGGFSESTLRVLGAASAIAGIALIYLGFSL